MAASIHRVKNAPADNRKATRLIGLLHCLSAYHAVPGKGGSVGREMEMIREFLSAVA
jgi:hypothetical protein